MFYSPFENIKSLFDIDKLQYTDLDILQTQEECYSIEYKRDYNADFREKKLPKAVCAFSNRNGGWLFVGVNDDGTLSDIDLLGITKEKLYSIISARVQPLPYVIISILENPNKRGFGVIAFYVNEGSNTPFISSGTIYIRNGKESIPADRSAIDLLLRKGYDYSNISLKCIDADCNEFNFSKRPFGDPIYKDSIELSFRGSIQNCSRIALYLQNDSKHFDENVELTIKIPSQSYYDILSNLKRSPNSKYEDIFKEFTLLTATPEIAEYSSPRLINACVPPSILASGSKGYELDYMNYLYENAYGDFQLINEGDDLFIKIIFKEINPQQKMFLPAMILCKRSLNSIEYTVTSKYSMSLITGTLTRTTKERLLTARV